MQKHYILITLILVFTNASAQIINFPDAKFKARLLSASSTNVIAKDLSGNYFKIDANNDGEIDVSEALNVSTLGLSSSSFPVDQAYSDATGVEYFTNVQYLSVDYNNLTALNIATLTQLKGLTFGRNQIASVDVSGFTSLESLGGVEAGLTALNVSGCTALEQITVADNALTTLNLNGLSALRLLNVTWNQLSTINTAGLTSMEQFNCFHNNLTAIDTSDMPNLLGLSCGMNQITSLDISNSPLVNSLTAAQNQLTWLNLKNGSYINQISFYIAQNPNLAYICTDTIVGEINIVNLALSDAGNANCVVNSYCSFAPGGSDHSISGQNRYDVDNNGCSASDVNYPNLKFSISDGSTSGTIISGRTGQYSIPLPLGYYTLTPVLENPDYYSVSPTVLTADFYTHPNPIVQDFCLSTSGNHSDLYVIICPIDTPRPGFNARYKIIYRNVGTTIQNGSVTMNFDDAILDFISSVPVVSAQTIGTLTWNFTNLLPMERGEIYVTFHVNSPVDIPPVVAGTVVHYSAAIHSELTDETPYNNVSNITQLAVNSFDPNDKKCLEGGRIDIEHVGKDVHYMIRFENSGTANADHVVVRDVIDTAKFDINSLVSIDGSHPFVTRIINNNEVEFYFENIDLPFDDANNDGYVLFKIKTKPTLVVGNTFSNMASIYFDYNSPIFTNPVYTIVAALATYDFDFENYFNIYPNPAKTILNINSKKQIEISSISIYNTLGQLVLIIPSAQKVEKVDVSNLKTGNYFIKIVSDKGTSNAKFIKN